MSKHSRSSASQHAVPTVTITCTRDGRAHHVPDVQIAGPEADRRGRYTAVCGHVVTAASMIEPEGTPCPLCAAL